jgi:poly-gamma-glutamate capsule biosynthesis protein CapA/YwtB (metallophosphatase superfamily)
MMADRARRVAAWLVIFASLATLAMVARREWRARSRQAADRTPAGIRGSGPLTVAAAGDTLVAKRWPAAGQDRAFDQVTAMIQAASVAMTNLEQRLDDGSEYVPADIRRAGFTVVTRANNHGADGGADGISATSRRLDEAGLRHAGAGADLDSAREPVILGDTPRRVAILAVTSSSADEARATRTRGEIKGRPGVSGLRVATNITADPTTYRALAEVAKTTHAGRESPSGLELSGHLIKPGANTSVRLEADATDLDDVLRAIAAARARADVVVVSLHSHEPDNTSVDPAAFIRDLAHQAIDRGASLVVGHGPRQLRGIEMYRGGAILYSLGNFAFDADALSKGVADVYDANTDLSALAVEALRPPAEPALPSYEQAVWWESVVATATFSGGALTDLRLDPIDLGTDRPLASRGLPRLASAERARAILDRVAHLSEAYGTIIRIEGGVGYASAR